MNKIEFQKPPKTTVSIDEKQIIKLESDFVFTINGKILVIKKCFKWNGSSVPPILRGFLGTHRNIAASLVHDFLYNTESSDYKINRYTADNIYKNILINNYKKNKFICNVAYFGIRCLGSSHYKKN